MQRIEKSNTDYLPLLSNPNISLPTLLVRPVSASCLCRNSFNRAVPRPSSISEVMNEWQGSSSRGLRQLLQHEGFIWYGFQYLVSKCTYWALREPIYPWGHIAPCQKILWTCQMGLKHGRISKWGLNMKKSHPRSSVDDENAAKKFRKHP